MRNRNLSIWIVVAIAGLSSIGRLSATTFEPTTIAFGNGVNTTEDEAEAHKNELKGRFSSYALTQGFDLNSITDNLQWAIAYNQTACREAGAGGAPTLLKSCPADLFEAYVQWKEQEGVLVDDYHFLFSVGKLVASPTLAGAAFFLVEEALVAIHEEAIAQTLDEHISQVYGPSFEAGRPVLLVAHSQGNFFGNDAFGELSSELQDSFRMVSVATPATNVLGLLWPYTTIPGDAITAVPYSLPANVPTAVCSDNWACHGFTSNYLNDDHARIQIFVQMLDALGRLQPPTPAPVFADDFNDNMIDITKWMWRGNTVSEVGGIMRIDAAITDRYGVLDSVPIQFDRTKPVIFERQARLWHANVNYNGAFNIFVDGHPEYRFGLQYAHYFYTGGTNRCVAHGFAVVANDGRAHRCSDRGVNVSEIIPPVWNTWFNERFVYDPVSGDTRYYIDGQLKIEFNVGPLPPGIDEISLHYTPWGWSTGHYQLMDDLLISQ